MILSTILNILNARWLQACVLLCAVVILPFGLAYAQGDKTNSETYLEQVYEKLQAEVESGNMSAEDAEAKMAAVKKNTSTELKTEVYLEQVYEKLQAEVESGNMSAEDAEAKMAAVKKKIAAKPKT